VSSRLFDWIWHIQGSLALEPGQSSDEVFARLDPLFRQSGTTHERTADTLTFRKANQAAQDKMSIFDGGTLQVEQDETGALLRYRLTSRALLFCFLAPLLFLALAGATIVAGKLERPPTEAETKAKEEKMNRTLPQHWVDKALGSPAPEKPKKDKDKKDKDKDDDRHSPTAAYIFAGIFAALYVIGRVLEARLINTLFKDRLSGASDAPAGSVAEPST